jgi:Alginate lyase
VTIPRNRSNHVAMWMVVASSVALASCAGPTPATPAPLPSVAPAPQQVEPIALSGWKLTLPVAGPKGTAASVDPAEISPPWLAEDPSGGLTFWAPADGALTPNSTHPRTELNSLDNFTAGKGTHALTASLAVSQVPSDTQDVIIGQIHGADDISSVAYVMLHYRAGIIEVVVKQKQSGSASDRYPLLYGVPLGARFDFGITDNGNGTMTFTASHGTEKASMDAPIPPAFSGATVRFQTGAYQQSDAVPGTAAGDDGARVTFYAVDQASD